MGPIPIGSKSYPAQSFGERAARRRLLWARWRGTWAVILARACRARTRGTAAGSGAGSALSAADFVVKTQRQRDPLARLVDVQNLDAYDVAGFHDLARVLHEILRHGRDVHQPILMNPDVDEGSKRGHVGHRAFEDHAGGEILECLDPLHEHVRLESR